MNPIKQGEQQISKLKHQIRTNIIDTMLMLSIILIAMISIRGVPRTTVHVAELAGFIIVGTCAVAMNGARDPLPVACGCDVV